MKNLKIWNILIVLYKIQKTLQQKVIKNKRIWKIIVIEMLDIKKLIIKI